MGDSYKGPLNKSAIGSTDMDHDPGPRYVVNVPGPDGTTVERDYLDLNLLSDDMRRRAIAGAGIRTRRPSKFAQAKAEMDAMSGLRIGYAFWGFLGDHKVGPKGERLSTPDGNAAYSWAIVHEAIRRGHVVMPMMEDRDIHGVTEFGAQNFRAFAQHERTLAYGHLVKSRQLYGSDYEFPELDVLLLEWRFPIPGRNTPDMRHRPGYQRDLERQEELLEHYLRRGTKVIVWDLDYKLTIDDEDRWGLKHIIETSVLPRKLRFARTSVEPPTIVDLLMEYPTTEATTLLSYIGSRYERDDVIDEWIRPIANRDAARGRIHFHGNWLKDIDELRVRWPGVSFHDRVTVSDFHGIYRCSAGVPLLAKREYMKHGFVTPRVWEALQFGALPIGLEGHLGISAYTPWVANDADDLLSLSLSLKEMTLEERDRARQEAIHKIRFMDARYFLDKIEGIVSR